MKRLRVPSIRTLFLACVGAGFIVPILSIAHFSLHRGDTGYALTAYQTALQDAQFVRSLWLSAQLALMATAVVVMLMVPTMVWLHTYAPRWRPLVEFISTIPILFPPILLVTGLAGGFRSAPVWFRDSRLFLCLAYVVLILPFAYRCLDAGLSAIDVRTLSAAGESLGLPRRMVLTRVLMPMMSSSIASTAIFAAAIVLSEYTMGSILQFTTFAVHISYTWESRATGAAALSVISFAVTWFAMLLVLSLSVRVSSRAVTVGPTT